MTVLRPAYRPTTLRIPPTLVEELAYVRTDSRRPSLLAIIRRPARTARLEARLDRYRWANAGLRDRLAELTAERERVRRILDDELANLADDGARLSHAVVRRLEAALIVDPTPNPYSRRAR